MEEITAAIMNEIERSDPEFIARDVGIEVAAKGLFERRRRLRVFGVVHSQAEKDIVMKVAQRHAGDSYDVIDELKVH
jgi:hypothetical protein